MGSSGAGVWWARLGAALIALTAGCEGLLSLGDLRYVGDAGPPDATLPDTSPEAGPSDASPGETGLPETGKGDAQTFDPADAANWQTVFTHAGLLLGDTFSVGAVFDGRYVAMAPVNTGFPSLTYDTLAPFQDVAAWGETSLGPDAALQDLAGAAYDGARLLLVPAVMNGAPNLLYYRDAGTLGPDAADWAAADLTPIAAPTSHVAAAFDGTYLYLTPSSTGTVVRVATALLPTPSGATFDMTQLNPSATSFGAAVYDGKYVYFLPNALAVMTRYDTTQSFSMLSSWLTTDLTLLAGSSAGFESATFDGRYIYMWGSHFEGTSKVQVVRFDTTHPTDFALPASSSWGTVAFGSGDAGSGAYFTASVFDGRYLYGVETSGTGLSVVLYRYDPTLPFVAGSFQAVAFADVLGAAQAAAATFGAATFDGQYVYFIPNTSDLVARFHARSPAALSPFSYASFH